MKIAKVTYCTQTIEIDGKTCPFSMFDFDRSYDEAMIAVELEELYGCTVNVEVQDIYIIEVRRGMVGYNTFFVNQGNPENRILWKDRYNMKREESDRLMVEALDTLNAEAMGII